MNASISGVLDILSQAFAVILLIGGMIGFIFRKWIAASIDAHFKKQLENERARLTKDIESYKRQLDGRVRISSRVSDKKVETYEIYYAEYGRVLTELQALRHLYAADPPIDPQYLEASRLNALGLVGAAKDKLHTCDFYVDPDIQVRIAALYHDLVLFIASGAQDESRLDQLTTEEAYIGAEMQTRLIGVSE